jgi:hypothetical protein
MWRRSRCAAYLRPFLAESGPLRGVCLGLGQWTLDSVVARPIRPCCVESSPCVRRQSGNFGAACRRSSVPVRTSRSVSRTLLCRLAESPDFSPRPSPAIAVPATFISLARLMDARERSARLASTYSPLGVLSAVNERAVLCAGTGWVLWYSRGAAPSPRPRRAQQWLHRAALCGALRQSPNRPIARRRQRRRERPERQRVRRFRLRRTGGVRRPSPRRRRPCRGTPLHWAADNGDSASVAELLLRGADGAVQDNIYRYAALRRTAEPKPQQPRACRYTPKQYTEYCEELAAYEAGESQVDSRPPPYRHPSQRYWC